MSPCGPIWGKILAVLLRFVVKIYEAMFVVIKSGQLLHRITTDSTHHGHWCSYMFCVLILLGSQNMYEHWSECHANSGLKICHLMHGKDWSLGAWTYWTRCRFSDLRRTRHHIQQDRSPLIPTGVVEILSVVLSLEFSVPHDLLDLRSHTRNQFASQVHVYALT